MSTLGSIGGGYTPSFNITPMPIPRFDEYLASYGNPMAGNLAYLNGGSQGMAAVYLAGGGVTPVNYDQGSFLPPIFGNEYTPGWTEMNYPFSIQWGGDLENLTPSQQFAVVLAQRKAQYQTLQTLKQGAPDVYMVQLMQQIRELGPDYYYGKPIGGGYPGGYAGGYPGGGFPGGGFPGVGHNPAMAGGIDPSQALMAGIGSGAINPAMLQGGQQQIDPNVLAMLMAQQHGGGYGMTGGLPQGYGF